MNRFYVCGVIAATAGNGLVWAVADGRALWAAILTFVMCAAVTAALAFERES